MTQQTQPTTNVTLQDLKGKDVFDQSTTISTLGEENATSIINAMTTKDVGRDKKDLIHALPNAMGAVLPYLRKLAAKGEASTAQELSRSIQSFASGLPENEKQMAINFGETFADRYPLLPALYAATDKDYIRPMLVCGGLKATNNKTLLQEYKELIELDHELKACFTNKAGNTVKSVMQQGADSFIIANQEKLDELQDKFLKLIEAQTQRKKNYYSMIDTHPQKIKTLGTGIEKFRAEMEKQENIELGQGKRKPAAPSANIKSAILYEVKPQDLENIMPSNNYDIFDEEKIKAVKAFLERPGLEGKKVKLEKYGSVDDAMRTANKSKKNWIVVSTDDSGVETFHIYSKGQEQSVFKQEKLYEGLNTGSSPSGNTTQIFNLNQAKKGHTPSPTESNTDYYAMPGLGDDWYENQESVQLFLAQQSGSAKLKVEQSTREALKEMSFVAQPSHTAQKVRGGPIEESMYVNAKAIAAQANAANNERTSKKVSLPSSSGF